MGLEATGGGDDRQSGSRYGKTGGLAVHTVHQPLEGTGRSKGWTLINTEIFS